MPRRLLAPSRRFLQRITGGVALRRRIAVLTAMAATLAIIIAGTGTFVVLRSSLYNQLDLDLNQVGQSIMQQVIRSGDGSPIVDSATLAAAGVTILTVRADGQINTGPAAADIALVGAAEISAARLQQASEPRTVDLANGTRMRVMALPFETDAASYALVTARSTAAVDNTLNVALLTLFITGTVAAAGSTLLGAGIARSSLRPLRDLASAVNRVTKTESLDPIDVDGDDELSRLGRSFNTMLYSLASSRARQNRLIADASHELRTPLTSLRTNIELLIADSKSSRCHPVPGSRS